jgi:hypothetical protein
MWTNDPPLSPIILSEEAKSAKCLDCVMIGNECEGFLCFPEERKDGKYVYFRKLEEGGKA